LVVDDDPAHRSIIARIGFRAGFQVVEAASLATALASLQDDTEFACLVIDLFLGAECGGDLFSLIAERHPRSGVIIITGADRSARKRSETDAIDAGVNVVGILPKPVDLECLRRRFEQVRGSAMPQGARDGRIPAQAEGERTEACA
jgi:DNA-binding NtrC family response regulator